MVNNIKTLKGICWGIIPARGGSKSVPKKNINKLNGIPLIDYCVSAAHSSNSISRTICSTDYHEIMQRCKKLKIEIHTRPSSLSKDETHIFDVIQYLINDIYIKEGAVAEFVALLQPTSPFILPEQIDECFSMLLKNKNAGSVQTIIECPHNHHAYNQRLIKDGLIKFQFPEERASSYNKQTKKSLYLFGNVLVFRTLKIIEQQNLFAEPSLGLEIPEIYGFDCDGYTDFNTGEALLSSKLIDLPHLIKVK